MVNPMYAFNKYVFQSHNYIKPLRGNMYIIHGLCKHKYVTVSWVLLV